MMRTSSLAIASLLVSCAMWACSGHDDGAAAGTSGTEPPVPGADGSPTDEDGGPKHDDGTADGGIDTDAGPRTGPTCTVPIDAVTITNPVVVGDGTAASCTEAALRTAITTATAANRPVTFSCGGAKTIAVAAEIALPTARSLVIDGGNEITIDGGGKTRIFKYVDGNFQTATAATLTFQRLTMINGKSTGTMLGIQGTGKCSRGYKNDANGGAIYSRNAKLHVIDCTFTGNKTATTGPDVGGGAIFSIGSVDTTIVRSHFTNNEGSNGGAMGSLFGNLRVYDSDFTNNRTTGFGGNGISADCGQQDDGQHEVGSGGLGGAIYADGAEKHTLVMCGVRATNNHGSALGGFLFRVGYDSGQGLDIDLSTFSDNICDGKTDDNFEEGSAGAIYVQQQPVSIKRSTFARNRARALGAALRLDYNAQVTMENVTIVGNVLSGGSKSRTDNTYGGLIGGGIFWSTQKPGTITSSTIANNVIMGTASGGFGAAIADPGGRTPAALTIDDSIFANNTAPNNGVGNQCQNTAGNGAHNVQWPMKRANGSTDDTACVSGVTFADPELAPLAGNPELAVPGAAASVVQVGTSCPAADAIGKTRATPCTLGAAER